MKPETRARTSTVSTATNRPVYSSHSVIFFCSGRDTVTGGGACTALATGCESQLHNKCANRNSEHKDTVRVIEPLQHARGRLGPGGRAPDESPRYALF